MNVSTRTLNARPSRDEHETNACEYSSDRMPQFENRWAQF